ncbi:MAG TPA: hypothetical protein VLF18_15270 [Tahibacter sp.]|uniref:hypothetical protein n=1 Tax=Tahibacter sp. TaxID=2056211 RepID=UPI002CF8113F|nr:hypothetical protein [Tahibacter sp.]HSX61561.1 hypothetical protein [Tahibacter sp.]
MTSKNKFVCFLLFIFYLVAVAGCRQAGPKTLDYAVFNVQLERVPDLINASRSLGEGNPSLIEDALQNGLKNGKQLTFLRVVPGAVYEYYVFQTHGVEDVYVIYAVKSGRLLYSFSYAGEANPQF